MTDTNPQAARHAASGSSFYWGMRLLPRVNREAMYAIYGFCRVVDDIADDMTIPDTTRNTRLRSWRDAIASLFRGEPPDEARFLLEHVQRFSLREADFLSVIDGMEMDANGVMIAPDLQTVDHYCDCVASAVGRLSVRVFGMEEEPGLWLAHHLGRALQLTNILRDLDEDAGLGRLYLPREFLEGAAIAADVPALAIAHPAVDSVCRAVAGLADGYYREAREILGARPRGDLRPPRLMAAVYSALLDRMKSRGWSAPREPARVPKPALMWLVLRHGFAA